MNKKANAVIFIIIAIVFNIGLSIGLIILGVVLFNAILGDNPDAQTSSFFMMILLVFASVGTILIYMLVLRLIMNKTNLEKYLPESLYKKKQK